MDTGTQQSLLQAANFVEAIEERQGLLIGSIEEVVFRKDFIHAGGLRQLPRPLPKSTYRQCLLAGANRAR